MCLYVIILFLQVVIAWFLCWRLDLCPDSCCQGCWSGSVVVLYHCIRMATGKSPLHLMLALFVEIVKPNTVWDFETLRAHGCSCSHLSKVPKQFVVDVHVEWTMRDDPGHQFICMGAMDQDEMKQNNNCSYPNGRESYGMMTNVSLFLVESLHHIMTHKCSSYVDSRFDSCWLAPTSL